MSYSRTLPRHALYVCPKFQGRVLLQVSFYWLAYHFLLWNLLFIAHYVEARGSVDSLAAQQPSLELYADFSRRHMLIVWCALGVLPLVLWDVLKLTHRIAGPLSRFRATLQALTAGRQVPFVRIRKDDLLHEFEQDFNAYLAQLEARNQPPVPTPCTPAPEPIAPPLAETQAIDLAELDLLLATKQP
jgi:hypothetical protein